MVGPTLRHRLPMDCAAPWVIPYRRGFEALVMKVLQLGRHIMKPTLQKVSPMKAREYPRTTVHVTVPEYFWGSGARRRKTHARLWE